MIQKILITLKAQESLKNHHLEKQYFQAVNKLISGQNSGTDLKSRKPKNAEIWSFCITKKYRAFCRKKCSTLTVFKIYNHQ